jgi:hypothetical protein
MKKMFLFLIVLFCFATPVFGDDAENQEFLYKFFSGSYVVIGKELNSEKTFLGKVKIKAGKDHLVMTRHIKGEVIRGTGKIEKTRGPDEASVLRVRYSRGDKEFEITYLWRCDLDNYARLSGYLYERGAHTDSPGMEVLFIDHSKEDSPSH